MTTGHLSLPNDLTSQEPFSVAASDMKGGTGKFPKSARLLTSSQFKFLSRNSMRHFGASLQIDYRQGRSSLPKLGLTVSKKFGKAHDRNRFKRVVREAFRQLYKSLPSDLEINISPRKSGPLLTRQAVLFELQALLAKIVRP